jgi:hypothetical protein
MANIDLGEVILYQKPRRLGAVPAVDVPARQVGHRLTVAYSIRVIAVVRTAQEDAANVVAKWPNSVRRGECSWAVALRQSGDAGDNPLGMLCGWSLTPAQATALRTWLNEAWMTDAEVRTFLGSEKRRSPRHPPRRHTFSRQERPVAAAPGSRGPGARHARRPAQTRDIRLEARPDLRSATPR